MAITGNKIWLKAVGGQILTTCFFTFLLSIVSIAMLFLVWFNKLQNLDKQLRYQIFVALNVFTLFLSCILLVLSTYGQASQATSDISDYIVRNPNATIVTSFLSKHPTSSSQTSYILQRTSNAYSVNAVFFAIWLIALIVACACNTMIENAENQEKKAKDEQNLLEKNEADNNNNDNNANNKPQKPAPK